MPGLIQGCFTFSVSPVKSQNNFVFSLLNRCESGLLYAKSGRNLSLLTRSEGKVYIRYIMSQSLKSGATVPGISVIKTLGLFYSPSRNCLGYVLRLSSKTRRDRNFWGMRGWDEVEPDILMKILNISRFGIKCWEQAAQPGCRSPSSLPTSQRPHWSAGESQTELSTIIKCLGVQSVRGVHFQHGPG